jgi:hypothetical protein
MESQDIYILMQTLDTIRETNKSFSLKHYISYTKVMFSKYSETCEVGYFWAT